MFALSCKIHKIRFFYYFLPYSLQRHRYSRPILFRWFQIGSGYIIRDLRLRIFLVPFLLSCCRRWCVILIRYILLLNIIGIDRLDCLWNRWLMFGGCLNSVYGCLCLFLPNFQGFPTIFQSIMLYLLEEVSINYWNKVTILDAFIIEFLCFLYKYMFVCNDFVGIDIPTSIVP